MCDDHGTAVDPITVAPVAELTISRVPAIAANSVGTSFIFAESAA